MKSNSSGFGKLGGNSLPIAGAEEGAGAKPAISITGWLVI
jgi:hypothetical protein